MRSGRPDGDRAVTVGTHYRDVTGQIALEHFPVRMAEDIVSARADERVAWRNSREKVLLTGMNRAVMRHKKKVCPEIAAGLYQGLLRAA